MMATLNPLITDSLSPSMNFPCPGMLMEYPSVNVRQFLLVFVTVLHAIAAITTCLRVWVRLRPVCQFWWEDTWACLALCFDIICAVSTWTLMLPQREHPWYMTPKAHVVSAWLQLLSYTSLKWAAKISMMFSLIRIVPVSCRLRRISNGFTISFFFLWALGAASKAYDCGSNSSWQNIPNPQCTFGLPIAVIEFTAAVVSDVVLIALPTHILYQMKLPKNERVLILSIFLMNLLSGLVSIVHLTFLIPKMGFMASMTADIEGAVNLINCNLLILVTSLYLFFGNGHDIESTQSSYGSTPATWSLRTARDTLTTVDLEHLETTSTYSTQSAPIPRSRDTLSYNVSSRSCCNVSVGRACSSGT